MQLKWKHYWAALGYVVTCGWATLPVLWDAPVVGVLGAAATGAGAVLFARHEFQAHPLFRQWRTDVRARASKLLGTAVGAHVLWVLAFETAPEAWPGWLAALLAVSGAEVGLAEALEYYERRDVQSRDEAKQDAASGGVEVVAAEPGVVQPQPTDDEYEFVRRVGQAIMQRAQLGVVEIQDWKSLGDAGVAFTAEIPDMASQSSRKKAQITMLSTSTHGEALAVAARRQLKKPIESSWVQIYKDRMAGMYTISVLTRDALGDVIPYVDAPDERPSIKDALRIGWRADQTPMTQRLDQCCYEVGKSQSGKSVFIHRKIAHVTQTHDAVQWVCGTSKLYDLVADWIEPYENEGIEPPINWICYGPQDTAEMMAAGLRIARDRQNQRKSERVGWKAIIIQLDESKVALNHSKAWAKVDGVRMHASAIWAELHMTGKSGWVFPHRADQRNVNDSAGAHGGDTTTNTDHTVVFQTNDPAEIGRATGDYKAEQPPCPGAFWRKVTGGDSPELGKAEYIQESDASKDRTSDGATIRDVSWSRKDHDNTLDDRAQRAAGSKYQCRHRLVNAEMIRYLKPVTTDDTDESFGPSEDELDSGDATPEGGGREEARAALASIPGLAAMLSPEAGITEAPDASWTVEEPVEGSAGEAGDGELDEAPEVPQQPVTALGQRQSRQDRIVQILQSAEEPLTRGQILTQFRAAGDEPSEQVIQNALGRLVKAGSLVRDEGTYAVPELAVAQ